MTGRSATVLAVVAVGLATVAVAPVPLALVPAAVGALGLALGTVAGLRLPVDAGALLLAASVALSGLGGLGETALVIATVATLLGWDAGRTTIDLGGVLDPAADSRRAELGHLGATTLVLGSAAGIALVAATLGPAGRPVGALVVLGVGVALVGAVLSLGD